VAQDFALALQVEQDYRWDAASAQVVLTAKAGSTMGPSPLELGVRQELGVRTTGLAKSTLFVACAVGGVVVNP